MVNADKHPWLRSGLSSYYLDRFFSENDIRKQESEFKASHILNVYHTYKGRTSEPLNTAFNALDGESERINRFYKSSVFFQYFQTLVGAEILDQTLNKFAIEQTPLTPEVFIQSLEKASGKELMPIFESYFQQNKTTNYIVSGIENINDKVHVKIVNKGQNPLPFVLTILNKQGLETEFLINGFSGKKTIETDYPFILDNIYSITIDKSGTLPETNRENNHYFPHKLIKSGNISLIGIARKGLTNEKELHITPFPMYNDNDGMMIGINFTNSNVKDVKNLKFSRTPAYSFQNKTLVGQSWGSYDQHMQNNTINKITYRLGVKSFNFNYKKDPKYEYAQRYIRIDPSIQIHFKHPLARNKTSTLSLKTFLIYEQYPQYTNGEYTSLKYNKSLIFKLQYDYKKTSTLSGTTFSLALEQQSYKQLESSISKENYLKLTASLNQRYMYAEKRNLYFRFFAGGFIVNTQRQSGSYQNVFSRGSIALIQQGFNDYTYDEYFFSRQNQTRSHDNQVSLVNGGGFKTPLGSTQPTIGNSNNLATALNLSADFPVKLPPFIPIRLYFDIGTFSTFNNSDRVFKNNVLYNGGVSINFKEILAFHIPLVYSTDLENAYKGQHKSFFSRISFTLNLHKLDFWKKIDLL
ncbi:MAG: hypothetical protein IPO92_21230 [Saprospiraceae bacterium]|nr:hypothetical protein [Saprospiraceae bacterium]